VKKFGLLFLLIILLHPLYPVYGASPTRWERLGQWGRWLLTSGVTDETQGSGGGSSGIGGPGNAGSPEELPPDAAVPQAQGGAWVSEAARAGNTQSGVSGLDRRRAARTSAVALGQRSGALRSYHDFKGRCLACHIQKPSPGDSRTTLRKDITVLCTKCHEQQDGLSHPVDIRPAGKVPSFLPLDWRGMITCVTCHETHRQGFGTSHIRTRLSGQAFCVLCHSGLDNNMHSISGVGAHMGGLVKVAYGPGNRGVVRLDEVSIKCMSCHDAALGGETTVANVDLFRSTHSNTTGLTHPIGVLYAEARRKYRGAYRPLDQLPPQIKLYGGRVGCGTCHSPYAVGHAKLVMNNYGSNLCLACHVK